MNNKVLLVDDNEVILEVLADTLEIEGIETVKCTTGAAALNEIAKEIYSTAVVDINLPDMNGREILTALKKRNHFTQVSN